MDRYEFMFKGQRCFVSDEGRRVALAVPFIGEQKREDVAAAEILRLAKENKRLREHAELVEARNESLERALVSVTEAQEILREYMLMSRHATPPAQEAEEPPDTSSPAPRG